MVAPLRHVGNALLSYTTFSGRAPCPEYWWFFALNLSLSLLLSGLFQLTENDFFSFLNTFFAFALFLPGLAVTVRRLHDTGRSGWWALLALTVVGIPVLIYFLAQPSPQPLSRGEGLSDQ